MRCLASTIAGSWYPGNARELRRMLDGYAAAVPAAGPSAPTPDILILPHAGYCYSAPTALYGILRIREAKFRRVLLLAPSHRYGFQDRLVAPESSAVSTPFGEIPIDEAALREISETFPVDRNDTVHAQEHAAQIEYPLLQYALESFSIVPLVVSELTEAGIRRMVPALRCVLDRKTLIVISSDFTHYGARFDFAPFGDDAAAEVKKLDLAAFEAIKAVDAGRFETLLEQSGATICGRNPIRLLLHLVPAGTKFELLHYANSANATGETGDFVCYLCAAGYADWPNPHHT